MDAIHKIPPDDKIEIDEKCIGCILCREACPYDAIEMETKLAEPKREPVPVKNPKLCINCGACVSACRVGAIELVATGREEAHLEMDEDKCIRCGYCARVCPTNAIKYGEILPRSVVGGKAITVNHKDCIGCMTCTRVCPSKGAINVGKMSKLPFIDPAYCARCEDCMEVCPSAAIRYSSRKKAYKDFSKLKTSEIVSELLEKDSQKLAQDAVNVDEILNRLARDLSYQHKEAEFSEEVTDLVDEKIEEHLDTELKVSDIKNIIEFTRPYRNIRVLEEECIGCASCIELCPVNCIELELPTPIHIGEECVKCAKCVQICPVDAIELKEEYFDIKDDKIFFNRKSITEPREGQVLLDNLLCQACGVCVNKCPVDALSISEDEVRVDHDKCILCGECETLCPVKAIEIDYQSSIHQETD